VVEFKNILSTITDRSGRKDDESAPKPLSRALGGRPRLPFQASTSRPSRTSADHTLAQALNFSDESLALNSTNMELTSCSPTNLAGIKRKHDQERLLMEGELETVKSKVLSLETQLDSEKTARKRMKVEHEKEWRDLQENKSSLEAKVKDLVERLKIMDGAKKEAQGNASDIVAATLSEKAELEENNRELEVEVAELRMKVREIKSKLKDAKYDINRLNDSVEDVKDDCDLQIRELEQVSELDAAKIARLTEECEELRECRDKAIRAENQLLDLKNKINLLEEEAQLGKIFKDQTEEIRKMQLLIDELRERNRILSTTQEDTSVLQEKLRSANSKIARAEDRLQEMLTKDLDITKQQQLLTEWQEVLKQVLPKNRRESSNKATPEVLRSFLAKSQQDLIYSSEQRQKIEIELGCAHDLERQLRSELEISKASTRKEQGMVEKQKEMLMKLRKKYQLITKERDSLRNVLNSYESDITADPSDTIRKRLEDMEEVLEGYRREMDREVNEAGGGGKLVPPTPPTKNSVATMTEPVMPPISAVAAINIVPANNAITISDTTTGSKEDPASSTDNTGEAMAAIEAEPQSSSCEVDLADAVVGTSADSNAPVTSGSSTDIEIETPASAVVVTTTTRSTSPVSREDVISREEVEARESELKKEVDTLKEKLANLEEENEKMSAILENQRMKGDYDPTNTKVIHMRFNPFEALKQKKLEEWKELKHENEQLQLRLRLLEESGGIKDPNLTHRVEEAEKGGRVSASKEIEDLKDKVKAAELKNKRLVEAFQKTSQDFREAVFRLLGFKVDIPTAKQYKLMSMYAESANDFLLFCQSNTGEMQLLETEYSESVGDLIDAYLGHADSIPAFLSSVTIDLFNKQTMVT